MKKEEFTQEFAKNFKNMIENNFSSQKEFADEFEVSTKVVSTWCTGKARPDIYKLHKIADYLGVSIDYIVKGEPHGDITKTNIDYDLFDKVYIYVHELAKEVGKKATGGICLSTYEYVLSELDYNNKLTLEQVFEKIKPMLTNAWKN